MRSPLLVIHDAGDREIEIENSGRLVSSWPGSRLQVTSGLGHRRILRDPSVIRTAVEFLSSDRAYAEPPRSLSGAATAASIEASTTQSFPSSLAR